MYHTLQQSTPLLAPHQFGFGLRNGCECIVCECPSEKHLHVNYKMVRVESMVESVDGQVQKQIEEHSAAIKKLEDDSNQKLSEEQKLRVVLDAAIQQLRDLFSQLKALCPWYNHTDVIEVMIQRLQQEKKDSTEVQEREDLDVVIQALKRINAELNAKQDTRLNTTQKKSAFDKQMQKTERGVGERTAGRERQQPGKTGASSAAKPESSSLGSWADSDEWTKLERASEDKDEIESRKE